MKRLLALILVAFMVFSLVACSDKKDSKSHTEKEKDDTTLTVHVSITRNFQKQEQLLSKIIA